MRRIKLRKGEGGVYHVVTRTVGGAFLLEERDREILRRMLWDVAQFCGVEVLTYAVLSNHFHVLVRVPPGGVPTDAELVQRCRALYPRGRGRGWQADWTMAQDPAGEVERVLAQGGLQAEHMRRALWRRMGDLSEFMKTLKQRFSIWYNHTHNRFGTLWAERFKSVLVEEDGYALSMVAAYIDLNAVRAGLVTDPKDYRWCGYGEAVGEGGDHIRRGLGRVVAGGDWARVLENYRMILFGKGVRPKGDGGFGAQIAAEQARAVLEAGGRLPLAVVLRCRVRYFTDGAVLGSAGFVGEALQAYQEATGRRRTRARPRPLRGCEEWSCLTTLRGLRRSVFG